MFGFIGLVCAAALVSWILSLLFRPNGSANYFFSGLNFLYFLFMVWKLWGGMGAMGFIGCFKFYFFYIALSPNIIRHWIMGA